MTSSASTASTTRRTVGLALFRQNCQRCHDQDGRGARSKTHMPEIPDFSSNAWQEARSDVDLIVSIVEGKGNHMPAFTGRLARAEVQDLVAQVRSYVPSARAAKRQDADFEKRFRALQAEMAELRRQYQELSQEASRR